MKTKIITILTAASLAIISAGCHHHDGDHYRPAPSRHYHEGDGWNYGQNNPQPRYGAASRPSYPYLYQLQ